MRERARHYEAKLQQLLITMLATRALAPQRLHNKAENHHDKLVTAAQPAAEPQAAAATRRRLGSCRVPHRNGRQPAGQRRGGGSRKQPRGAAAAGGVAGGALRGSGSQPGAAGDGRQVRHSRLWRLHKAAARSNHYTSLAFRRYPRRTANWQADPRLWSLHQTAACCR